MKIWFLPALLLVLSLMSILTLKSVAPTLATQQVVYFLLGGAIFYGVGQIKFENWLLLGPIAYVGVCLLLLVPLALGTTTRGIAGWIDIGTLFSIQPSQLAIPAVTLWIGQLLTQYSLKKLNYLAIVLGLIGLPAVLILLEPDLGTTIVYLASLGSLVFASDIKWSYLVALGSMAVMVAVLSWAFVLADYQKDRITSFISPTADTDASYNAQQAMIAVGSGQILGRGLGQGVQSHLRFLPERQTDFIFASLAEEWGLLGSSLVISLYAALSSFLLWLSWQTTHPAAKWYCLAAAVMTAVQSGINIGMNMGLFPITGITLPLLSYGGSSILALCGMYGIIWSIARERTTRVARHFT
ncbi:MAG TPA: FtsW/RodA/SpoVE family cell cycle protein [Vitreimonas sp.]|nr:FtsW/RodA/SpoVE family cell cycle protein [Vitreimonas sp.]